MRHSSELVRWLVSACLAGVLTSAIFLGMTRLVDATALLRSVFQLFPLSATEVSDECLDLVPVRREVTIRGAIGFYHAGRFTPLGDAAVLEAGGDGRPLARTSPAGEFEFATHFATGRPASCDEAQPAPDREFRQITIRAPGCRERRVPLTPAWVPHSIVLECDRSGERPPA